MKLLPNATLMRHLNNYLEQQPLPDELWVFAYGSLLWNPDMEVIEALPAKVTGFSRGFNLLSTVHRGTPENPGLVLALREGGSCEGQALKISDATKHNDFTKLWLREMVTMFYQPTWLNTETPQGNVKSIAFVADPNHQQYVEHNCQTSAQMIMKAHGGKGPNIDYFHNTHQHLQSLQITDPLFESIAEHLSSY